MQFELKETPYPFVAMVPQNVTERLLAEELQRRGRPIEYETAFVSADQQDGYVNATLSRKGESQTLKASVVVGCDGAHSTVRKIMDLPLEGGEYDSPFMLADVETNDSLPADELQLCPSELGPLAIFPMSATRRRIVATVDIPMASHFAPFQHAFVERLSELGITYSGSPIVEGSAKRYLDDSMRGGEGIKSRFLLLIEDQNPVLKEAADRLCSSLTGVVEMRPSHHRGVTLIRPDGYVAYSTPDGESMAAIEAVRSLLERQIFNRSTQSISA
jgi:hypothetical protein